MLAANRPFTAVNAFDDLTALGVASGLLGAGVRVPEDCTVLGFGDLLPAAVATPALTTIRQPLREMGLMSAERVAEAIKAANRCVNRHRDCIERRRSSWCECSLLPTRGKGKNNQVTRRGLVTCSTTKTECW
jgi:DNA-binding LacI/PurR family transcriptional regulator